MDMMSLRRRVMVNQNKLMTATGNPITFNTPLTKPLKECVVRFTPKQSGSGTPSPDNVRNISGRSSMKLWQSGKNMFDKSNVVGGFINSNGDVTGSSSSWAHQYIYIKGINKLTISGSYSNTAVRNVFFDADMNPINTGTAATTKVNRTLTVPSGAVWYGCSSYINPNASKRDIDTLQVEIGETATEYEPYTGNEITFTFPSTVGDSGVVYGGYLDAENGEVVEEYVYRDMTTFSSIKAPSGTSEPWNHRFSLQHWANNTAGYDRVAGAQVMCDCIDTANGSGRTNYTGDASTAVWYVYDDTISTVAEFKEKYAGHYVAYRRKVALHEHYSLTPQSIATLKGQNVMWSDANGDISVKYWTR